MEINIAISYTDKATINAIDTEFASLTDAEVEKVEQSGFDGMDILFYFITSGGAAALISSLEKIIVAIIKRNDVKSFKMNDLELKGYSANQIEKILKQVMK